MVVLLFCIRSFCGIGCVSECKLCSTNGTRRKRVVTSDVKNENKYREKKEKEKNNSNSEF